MERNIRLRTCAYCSDTADCRDHVIPVASLGPRKKRFAPDDWTVDACSECNNLLGAQSLFTVPARAAYLVKRYEHRWRKVLTCARWTDDEIADLRGNLRRQVEAIEGERDRATKRLAYVRLVASQLDDYLKPD